MSGTALADAVLAKLEELAGQFFVQGVVQPNATSRYVLVDVDGQAPQRCPYVSTYRPTAGDVVWLAGPPGSWVCLGTISGIRDLAGATVTATRFRGPLGAPGDAQDGYGTWHGNVAGDGANTQVDAAYILSGGDMRANRDINAGRSIGAALNVIDSLGNVRNGASMPDMKTDLEEIDPAEALAALAKLDYFTFRYIGDFVAAGPHGELRRFAGPMLPGIGDDPLLATMVRREVREDGTEDAGFDIQSMVGMIAAALPAIEKNLKEFLASLGPLKRTADQLPVIVARSDEVHTELQQGLDALRTAMAAVQQAAGSLGTSLPPIAQLAAQAQAAAAIATANATAANQRTAALEAQMATLQARKPQTWRAAGNLPTLALNGTAPVTCPWTSPAPSPLPTVDQCQVFVAGSATPTVTAVSATGVSVSLKAVDSLLPAKGAVQVLAVTW